MRALKAILALPLLVGCDPVGLRRVDLLLPPKATQPDSIVVEQANVADALRILDATVLPLGFEVTPEPAPGNYVRVYGLKTGHFPIRVVRIAEGIELAFGEYGLLGGPPPGLKAFKGTRAAFVQQYGKRNVKTKTFGPANYPMQ